MTETGLPAAVVFDMDGLLLDTERLALSAFEDACAAVGADVDPGVYRRCIGSNWETTRTILTEALGSAAACDRLDVAWQRRYDALIDAGALTCKPGATDLLEALAGRGVRTALATSTRRATAEHKLAATGLIHHFQVLICGGETPRGKPHPDPFLAAVGALGVAPARCWALEDSENGVRAAVAAGLVVFQVPDLVPPTDELRRLGHRVVADLMTVRRLLESV